MTGIGIFLISLIVASTFTIYHLVRSKHIENLAKIEHGIVEDEQQGNLRALLFLGIFLCSLGGGFLFAHLISTYSSLPEYIVMPSGLLLFGGAGLILSYLVNLKISK